MHATNVKGELLVDTDGQHNEWLTLDELDTKEKRFGSGHETITIVNAGITAIREKKYHYKADDY